MYLYLFFVIPLIFSSPLPIPHIFGLGEPCSDHLKESSCISYCACAWDVANETCIPRSKVEGEAETLTSCDHNVLIISASAGFLCLFACFCCFDIITCCLCCAGCIFASVKRKKIKRKLERYKNHPLRPNRLGPRDYELDEY